MCVIGLLSRRRQDRDVDTAPLNRRDDLRLRSPHRAHSVSVRRGPHPLLGFEAVKDSFGSVMVFGEEFEHRIDFDVFGVGDIHH